MAVISSCRKLLVGLGAAVVLVLLVALFPVLSPTAPLPPLPNPNGYDDFLKAAAALVGDVGNASSFDTNRLRLLVSTNVETLRLVRLGLSRTCSVPTEAAMTNISGVLADLRQLKSLAWLLVEEGWLAEMEGRFGDAAHSYVDAIRFGNEISRGGFIISRMVGISCEAIGDAALCKIAPKLSPEEAKGVLAELEKIDATGITWEEVQLNESRFEQYQLSKGFNPLTWLISRPAVWRSLQRAEMRHKRILAHLRLLTVELALRFYQSTEGRMPTGLGQLVPRYLQRVPSDPFGRGPLMYHPQGTNWLLYSIGEDGVDDGGKPVGRSASGKVTKGDIFYDSHY